MPKESYKKLKNGKIKVVYEGDDMPLKIKNKEAREIGISKHIQEVTINSEEEAIEYLDVEKQSIEEQIAAIDKEMHSIVIGVDHFECLGEYLIKHKEVLKNKKLKQLEENARKYQARVQLQKNKDLQEVQHKKIITQIKAVKNAKSC